MIRILVVASTLTGCFSALPISTAALPPIIGMTAVPAVPSSVHGTLSGGPVRGAPGHAGGWGVALDTSSVGRGYIAHGKIELGRWGRDGFYGSTGAEAGVGIGADGFGGGLLIGYDYGGFPQNGHTVPIKLMGLARLGPVNARLSGYVGWRFGVRDEYPAAEGFALGWNTYGAELSTIIGANNGGGLAIVVGLDNQDDIPALWLKFGVGVGVSQ